MCLNDWCHVHVREEALTCSKVVMSHFSCIVSDNVDGESSQAESSRQAAHGQRLCTHLQTCHAFEAPHLSWRSRQADELGRAMSHFRQVMEKGEIH